MDELLRNWLRRYFADSQRALKRIDEELLAYPPEVGRQFHSEKEIIDEYFALVMKEGHCPSEVWLGLHPGLSKGAEAIIKSIDRVERENRKAAQVGRKLGPYHLLYRIGAGGMAEVYAVEKTDVEVKHRALKIIHLAQQYLEWDAPLRQKLRDDLEKRLLEEAANLEKIHHPRVVRYFDVLIDPTSGELCIVTELIEGFSLERLLEKGGSLPLQEALAVAMAICEGLVEVHHKDVIHRDLTPANVLIDREGNVKIIDFGLAKSLIPSAGNSHTGLDRFQWRTKRYASPEQLRGEKARNQSDLYMLGKLLYVLLLYRPEWETEEDWPIPPRENPIWNSLPADVASFILQATVEVAAERFCDATTMLEKLRRLSGEVALLPDCIHRVRELQDENDPVVNVRIGDWLATRALPPRLPSEDDPNILMGSVVEPPKLNVPRRRVLVASGLALVSLAVVAPLVMLSLPGAARRGTDSKAAKNEPVRPISFKGESFWRLISRPGAAVPAQGLPLGAPDASYLKGGDLVAFQSELTQGPEAYFYVLHIDVKGVASLVYPRDWTWKNLPSDEQKHSFLRLPEEGGAAPLKDSATGLESLLWLVRLQPLTVEANASLEKILTPPKLQWEQTKEMLQMGEDEDDIEKPVWLENGIFRKQRGGILLNQARIDKDPVRQTEKIMLAIRDQKLASYTRAVCYAFVNGKIAKKK